jgi:hypothetical protein
VIDGDRDKLRRTFEPLRPTRSKHEKRRRVATARNGKNEAARIFQTGE